MLGSVFKPNFYANCLTPKLKILQIEKTKFSSLPLQ